MICIHNYWSITKNLSFEKYHFISFWKLTQKPLHALILVL